MYWSPCRRRGRPAGARARRVPVAAHEGTAEAYLRRHEREAATAARSHGPAREQFLAALFDRAADSRNLRLAFDHLADGGGQAPGIDGLRFDDLDRSGSWALVRRLGVLLRDGTYRPSAVRQVPIPKSSGNGFRTLSIPAVADRVVQRAVVQAVQPFLEPTFDPHSFGYRRDRGVQHALALAAKYAEEQGKWVWVVEDVKNAFDNVPQQRLLDAFRKLVPNDGLVGLVGKLIATQTGRGIPQGGCLSPLLLNVYLHHFLDRVWHRRHPDTPLIRVADDLLVLCKSKEEALGAYADLKQLLRVAGMPLKGSPEATIRDLAGGDHADWLGYRLQKGEGGLRVGMTEKAWGRLEMALSEAHGKPDSSLRATEAITGWLAYLGPCFPTTDLEGLYARVKTVATGLAFEEVPSEEDVRKCWQSAHARWNRTRESFSSRTGWDAPHGGDGEGGGGSARRHRNWTGEGPVPTDTAPVRGSDFTLATDGSCLPGSAAGGWAFVLTNVGTGGRACRSGGTARSTNNRMELEAAIRGLEAIAGPARVRLVTDSEYVAKGVEGRLALWEERGWRSGSGRRGKGVKNRDLWERLAGLLRRHEVECVWVRGHAGDPANEECDRLAREAALAIAGV